MKLSSAESYLAVLDILRSAGIELTDLDLSRFPNLQALPLNGGIASNGEIVDLSDFSKIRRINLAGTKISNLSALNKLQRIETLNLSDTLVTDLNGLFVSKLLELSIAKTNFADLSPLASANALQILDISQTKITDLSPLSKLSNLRSLYLSDTSIHDLSPIRNLTQLQILFLKRTAVTELSALTKLTSLNRLIFSNTRIADIEPLAKLTSLEYLDFSNTPVSEIGSLSNLYNLKALHISNTPVSDLAVVANFTSLIGPSMSSNGLYAKNCPIKDAQLAKLLEQPSATKEVINYLRNQQGLPPISTIDDLKETLKKLEQNPFGARFQPTGDNFVISPSGYSNDQDAARDPLTQQLHSSVKHKARELASRAIRLANQPGWQELAYASERFRQTVDSDVNDLSNNIGLAWGELVSLGSFLEQDSEVIDNPGLSIEPLDPDVRRPLTDLIQSAGPWLRRFPTALKLDEQHASFQTPLDRVPTARAVMQTAKAIKILRAEDAAIIDLTLAAGAQAGHQSAKARGFGVFSVRNLVVGAAGVVSVALMEGFVKQIGEEVAKHSILAEKSVNLILSKEGPILQFIEHLPADIRAAVKAIVDQLKQQQEGTGFPLPNPPAPEPPISRRRKTVAPKN